MEIFVGNLPFDITEQEIRDKFAEIGVVSNVKMLMDKFSGRFRGIAFVSMDDQAQAEKAVETLNGADLGGRPMKVDKSRERGDRFNGFGGGFQRQGGRRFSDGGGFRQYGDRPQRPFRPRFRGNDENGEQNAEDGGDFEQRQNFRKEGFRPRQEGFRPRQGGFRPRQEGFRSRDDGFRPRQDGFRPRNGGFNKRFDDDNYRPRGNFRQRDDYRRPPREDYDSGE